MQLSVIEYFELAFRHWRSLVCKERFFWTPCHHSCRWFLTHLPPDVESLVFFGFLSQLPVEVSIHFVHPRVPTLSEVR